MSKVDDELTRRFHRAERPLDSGAVFEGIASRRGRRETIRRIEVGFLAITVLVATGAGFLALRSAFGSDRHRTAGGTAFGAEGAIVPCEDAHGTHLCRIDAGALGRGANPADVLKLTNLADEIVSMPSVSRDGTTVVFDRFDPTESGTSLWTVGVDGTRLRRLSTAGSGLTNASWGPDGSLVAVAAAGTPGGEPAALAILDRARAPAPVVRTIPLPGLSFPSTPRFSPDGRQILFVAGEDPNSTGSHVYTVTANGDQVTKRGGTGAMTPDWSPDGRQIVFSIGTMNGVELFVCRLDCSSPRLLEDRSGSGIDGGLPRWSPDGGWIAYRTEDDGNTVIDVVDVDRGEIRRLSSNVDDIAWITAAPQPTPPAGRDIGLGFRICDVQELHGIDWYGDGTNGTAWTGARVMSEGRCPEGGAGEYIVAADLDGDGVAEPGGMGFIANCLLCRPYGATDLDGDGVLELVVLEEASSTQSYSFFEVSVPTSERSPGIYNLFVAPPGHPEARVEPGEPLRIDSGGDEGYSSQIRCGDGPDGRELGWAWSLEPVDAAGRKEVHVLRIVLQADRAFHVIGVEEYSVPAGESTGLEPPSARTCGVNWNP